MHWRGPRSTLRTRRRHLHEVRPPHASVQRRARAASIWSGIVGFEFYSQLMRPALPLDGGVEIVGIVMVDAANAGERSPTVFVFLWRIASGFLSG